MTPFAGECQEVFVAAVPFDLFSDPGHFVLVEKARRARGEKNDRGNGWFFLSYVFRHTVFERPLRLRFFDKVSYLVTTTCFFVAMMLLGVSANGLSFCVRDFRLFGGDLLPVR